MAVVRHMSLDEQLQRVWVREGSAVFSGPCYLLLHMVELPGCIPVCRRHRQPRLVDHYFRTV